MRARRTWLVTGAAGFIGAHVCRRLLLAGERVVGVDGLNDYYDVQLKRDRLEHLVGAVPASRSHFSFYEMDLRDSQGVLGLFRVTRPAYVVHLAAQAGVRYSLEAPLEYIGCNVVAFQHVLEACREAVDEGNLRHLVYASSSSVYGDHAPLPFSEHDPADHPVSLYAATKRAGELLAHSYSHLYGLPTTALRFFTVYGPWGRPDMAYWRFADAILHGRPVSVFGDGTVVRDFTYVDDVVEAVVRVARLTAKGEPAWSAAPADAASSSSPWRVFNVGRGGGASIEELIGVLEQALGKPADRRYGAVAAGDVTATKARVDDLAAAIGYRPRVSLEEGIGRFVAWYLSYVATQQLQPSCPRDAVEVGVS